MSRLQCWQARRAIHALLDGELSPERAARLEAHAAQCPACARLREDLCGWDALLREVESDLPSEAEFAALAHRITTAVRQRPQPMVAGPRPVFRPTWAMASAMAVACLVLGLAVGHVATPQASARVVYLPAPPAVAAPATVPSAPSVTAEARGPREEPAVPRATTVQRSQPRRSAPFAERRLAMRVPEEEAWSWADRVAPTPPPPAPARPAEVSATGASTAPSPPTPEAVSPSPPAGLGGGMSAEMAVAAPSGPTGRAGAPGMLGAPGPAGPSAAETASEPREVRPPATELARVAMVLRRDVSRAGDALPASGIGSALTASFSAAARELGNEPLGAGPDGPTP